MLRILIADDFTIIRRGLKQILLDEYPSAIIEEAGDYPELLKKASGSKWDLIVSDFSMPGGTGLEAIRQIRAEKLSLPFLFISIGPEEQYALSVLKAGASGYLSKDSVAEELIRAVKQVVAGKPYVSKSLTEKLSQSFGHRGNGHS